MVPVVAEVSVASVASAVEVTYMCVCVYGAKDTNSCNRGATCSYIFTVLGPDGISGTAS